MSTEQIGFARPTRVQLITPAVVIIGTLVLLSATMGVLNFLVPSHFLIAGVFVGVTAVLLFVYPFVGLLVYQFINIIQPGALFPSLAALPIERVMALFLIVALIINIKLRRGRLVVTHHRLLIALSGFVLAMVISVPGSYWPSESVNTIIEFLKTIAFLLLIINLVNTPKRLKIFFWEYLLLVGYMAVSSFIAYKTGNVMEAQGIIRAKGLSGLDPNSLAITLVLALPFHFLTFRLERNLVLKGLTLFLVVMHIMTVVVTGSRGGMIGMTVVVLCCWWVLPARGIRIFLLLAGAFILVASMPEQYQQRYATIFSKERDASSEERLKVWNKGIRMFTDRPFTGVGTGAFGAANAAAYSEGGRRSYLKAHNLYVQLAAELGVFGIVAFFTYAVTMLIYQRKYRRYILETYHARTWIWALLMAMTIAIFTLFAVGMFGHNLYRANWYYYGALTVAVSFILGRMNPESQRTPVGEPAPVL